MVGDGKFRKEIHGVGYGMQMEGRKCNIKYKSEKSA